MSRSLSLVVVPVAASLLAACSSPAEHHPTVSRVPQTYPIVTDAGDAAGWLVATHDAWNLDLQFVMNPGFAAAGAVVCPAPDGWIPADSCGWSTSTVAPVRQASLTVALPDLEQAVGNLCDAPVLLEANLLAVGTSATSPAWAGAAKGRFAFAFTCDDQPQFAGCARDAQSWAATANWPVNGVTFGGVAYKRDELLPLLADSSSTDASVILLRAVTAAKLSEAAGATAPAAIDDAIAHADAWAQQLPARVPSGLVATPGMSSNGATWDDGVATASIVDRFNEGAFGPETCK